MRYTPAQYERKVKKWARKSPEAIERGLRKAAVEIIGEARAHHLSGPKMAKGRGGGFMGSTLAAPTGTLKRSLSRADAIRINVKPGQVRAQVGTNVSYGRAHEYGSRKRNLPERPFLRPSVQTQRKRTLQLISDEYIGAYKRGR